MLGYVCRFSQTFRSRSWTIGQRLKSSENVEPLVEHPNIWQDPHTAPTAKPKYLFVFPNEALAGQLINSFFEIKLVLLRKLFSQFNVDVPRLLADKYIK